MSLELKHNVKKHRYETIEAAVLYGLPDELVESLKHFYKHRASVEAWFAQLPPGEKKKVIREGLPETPAEYDDGTFLE